jgi:CheY-like chemotaxis protein
MGCGEDVETNPVERDGKTELTCIFCGFTLDVVAPDDPARADCIITAEDADVTRSLLESYLLKSRLAREVIAVSDGGEFVSAISKRLPAGQPVDLAILDIEMPGMDGFTAARVLRTLESKLRGKPCPIIFFSGKKADENLKRQMALYSPVRYLNKGTEGDVEDLMSRVGALVTHLSSLFGTTGKG